MASTGSVFAMVTPSTATPAHHSPIEPRRRGRQIAAFGPRRLRIGASVDGEAVRAALAPVGARLLSADDHESATSNEPRAASDTSMATSTLCIGIASGVGTSIATGGSPVDRILSVAASVANMHEESHDKRSSRMTTPGCEPARNHDHHPGEPADAPGNLERAIYTIGHSTRTLADFITLLRQVDVDLLVDVRSFPRSRAMPQFNIDTLPGSLAAERIGYRHLQALGGRRHHKKGAPDSLNSLWRVAAFRSYADYAETDAFRAGLDELLALARSRCCAIMCAEAVWWRCHRRIIADYLLARGVTVKHIMGPGKLTPAVLTPGALVLADGSLRYPAPP